jgi:uncharacterized membrane protein YhhN
MSARGLTTSARPWFLLAVAICVVGVVLGGRPEAVLVSVGGIAFLLACTRYIALAVRDDPVRSRIVGRRGLMGLAAQESGVAQRRRAAKRAARRSGGRP